VPLPEGSLRLRDRSYFCLESMRRDDEAGV